MKRKRSSKGGSAHAGTPPDESEITRREERRLRAEEAKAWRETERRQRVLRTRFAMVAGVVIVLALLFAATRRGTPAGRVWSAEHGHWHDQ
jgi:hypothetical protein